MKLAELNLDKFIAETASGEPVPGGGSISALCGALATALGSMVAGLTIGKKKYADVQDLMTEIRDDLNPKITFFTQAIDLDSAAYDAVSAAYRMPKDTEEQKSVRSAAIQEAMKGAANVPFTVAETAVDVIGTLREVMAKGNSNAVTDAYVALICARAAVMGACANVRINLLSITDTDFVAQLMPKVEQMEAMADEAEAFARETLLNALY